MCLVCFAERIQGNYEKQRYDGWYNNLAYPEWGAVGGSRSVFTLIHSDILICNRLLSGLAEKG